MNSPQHIRFLLKRHRAFSLVELLVVIAIIAVLMSVGTFALRDSSNSSQSAATVASSMFGLARTEAILRRVPARVVIDTVFNPARPDDYLRRMAIVVRNEAGNGWTQISRWTVLPANAFYNPNLSVGHGTEVMSGLAGGAADGPYAYWEFQPSGQAASPRAQFIVSRGRQTSGTFEETGDSNRSGFFVHKLGRLTFFSDPSEIPAPRT